MSWPDLIGPVLTVYYSQLFTVLLDPLLNLARLLESDNYCQKKCELQDKKHKIKWLRKITNRKLKLVLFCRFIYDLPCDSIFRDNVLISLASVNGRVVQSWSVKCSVLNSVRRERGFIWFAVVLKCLVMNGNCFFREWRYRRNPWVRRRNICAACLCYLVDEHMSANVSVDRGWIYHMKGFVVM